MKRLELWNRYKQHLCVVDGIALRLDISRMNFDDSFFDRMSEPMARALSAMESAR